MPRSERPGTAPFIASREFTTFAAIGAAAFFVDAGALYAFVAAGSGLYVGRLLSWTLAASFTWYLNRRLTFAGADGQPAVSQWLRFIAANSVGGALNYATYASLIALSATVRHWPVVAVAAGSLAGLLLNFVLSRKMVFRSRQ